MITFKVFQGTDLLEAVALPPLESGLAPPFQLSREVAFALEGNAWTAMLAGSAVACGGTIEVWAGRSLSWCYLTRPSRKYLRRITKLAAEVVAIPPGRVEATVREDYPRGHRWMEMLGFEVETPLMRRFGPYGEDHVGYVRFNDVIRANGI